MPLQFFDRGFVLRKRGQVPPLARIDGVVIQFFATILILDVAPVLHLDGVVARAVGHHDRAILLLAWVFQMGLSYGFSSTLQPFVLIFP